MSEIEKLEAEYRLLATKVIYAGFDGDLDPVDQQQLDRLGEELIRLNAADFSRTASSGEPIAA